MRNAIIIPCYNEANRLKFDAFQNFIDSEKDYFLCFVNDGSKDETLSQLQNFAKGQENRVIVHDMPQNGGKAEAVRQGINHMIQNFQLNHVGFLDADLATGFEDYTKLAYQLERDQLKMVFGSRKLDAKANIERSMFRNLASLLVGLVIKIIVGLPIKDTQCGAKIFTIPLARYLFNKSFMSRWLFDVELFIKTKNFFGKKSMEAIREIAVNHWEEVEGSHITFSDAVKFPKELLQIAFAYNITPFIETLTVNRPTAIIKTIKINKAA